MTFLESLKTCLIDKPFTFSGRASRSEYWWFVVVLIVGYFIFDLIFPSSDHFSWILYHGNNLLLKELSDFIKEQYPTFGSLIFTILMFIPSLALEIRRLHDINRSGWWAIIFSVPVIGWIWSLLWMIKKGTPGPNRFGEDPLAKVDAFGDISG